MKKLNLAIIGQGRSGKNIHGIYYLSARNQYYDVKFVVDGDEGRRQVSAARYPGCTVLSSYTELFAHKEEIDLVVNATYSDDHFPITLDLLTHGFHVLCEKPLARTTHEIDQLLKTARENQCKLAVFHQTLYAPYFAMARELCAGGVLGDILEIDLRFSGFARRWDWQTLQKRVAGNTYNTGPHPISVGLALLDNDKNSRVVYAKLAQTMMTSGDADDFAKILIDTPNKPMIDIEIHSTDAYSDYNLKLIGTKGTFKATPQAYSMKYIVEGENPNRPVQADFLQNAEGNPIYCGEKLISHEVSDKFSGTAFDVGTAGLYEELYFYLTEDRPMRYTAEDARDVIGVIETVHAMNHLELRF